MIGDSLSLRGPSIDSVGGNIRRALLGFRKSDDCWIATPYLSFKPKGLLVWNAPPLSTIRCVICNAQQIVASFEDVPTRWFSTAKSFEQLAELLEEGKEPPTWCDFHSLSQGQQIKIYISDSDLYGTQVELCMWGLAVE